MAYLCGYFEEWLSEAVRFIGKQIFPKINYKG